jgi:D-alanyl-D-alanine carboxypeptidase
VIRAAVIAAVIAALAPASSYHSSIRPLPASVKTELEQGHYWHTGCPVALSDLRLLTVTYRGFDKHNHTGQMVVNKTAAAPLTQVFHELYRIHFPIHYMSIAKTYGVSGRPSTEPDPTGSFECRDAVPSPCTGGRSTGQWSNHAYGLAVDLNPVENPYVGCGMSRDPTAQSYRDRSRHRTGMVTPRVVAAFRSIGWGWGGGWSGNTKDYMHFSYNGH